VIQWHDSNIKKLRKSLQEILTNRQNISEINFASRAKIWPSYKFNLSSKFIPSSTADRPLFWALVLVIYNSLYLIHSVDYHHNLSVTMITNVWTKQSLEDTYDSIDKNINCSTLQLLRSVSQNMINSSSLEFSYYMHW
jgi:hypothetical protein